MEPPEKINSLDGRTDGASRSLALTGLDVEHGEDRGSGRGGHLVRTLRPRRPSRRTCGRPGLAGWSEGSTTLHRPRPVWGSCSKRERDKARNG